MFSAVIEELGIVRFFIPATTFTNHFLSAACRWLLSGWPAPGQETQDSGAWDRIGSEAMAYTGLEHWKVQEYYHEPCLSPTPESPS